MKRNLFTFSRSAILFSLLFILAFNVQTTRASDLKPYEILSPQLTMSCIAFKVAFTVCNINIYDAQPNEWSVDVTIKKDEVPYFEETVQGVFLGNGSEGSPTCTELETVNSFFPELEGVYKVEIDVNYIYDIDPTNDTIEREFTVECAMSSIRGQKFEDYNNNAAKDSNEVGIDGVLIHLWDDQGFIIKSDSTKSEDLNSDGKIDPITESGLFLFDSLDAGDYEVSEVIPTWWTQTYPGGSHFITLPPAFDLDGVLFGNFFDGEYDYGDLPDPFDPDDPCAFGQCYPTVWPLGARHPLYGPTIGNVRDGENDGQPSLAADGDDWVWLFGIDDEEGVEFVRYNVNDSGEVKIVIDGTVPNDFPCYLSGWIDFNGDRLMTSGLGGPNETIVSAVIGAPGTYNFKFKIPDDATEHIYSRFRVSTFWWSVVFSFGTALDGEVEDHSIYGLDFGDANEEGDSSAIFPHGYPVKATSNGARHIISPLRRLGDEDTDPDMSGYPSYYANGDNNDNEEDENGILYGNEFFVYYDGPDPDNAARHMTIYGMEPSTNVSITPLATQTGLFNMWVDWNRDGDWADADEQIFDDEVILPGPTYTTLNFDVPANAVDGYTYARYRLSTQTGLEFTGAAPDGEVEDHILMIGEATGVDDEQNDLPKEFRLYQNYPNPFNPSTSISFALPIKSDVVIKVYNALGQVMEVLLNDFKQAGIHKVGWHAENMTSGVYFYRIEATPEDGSTEFVKVGKMILVR